jgi:Ca2+-binding RTX toxin-like protein
MSRHVRRLVTGVVAALTVPTISLVALTTPATADQPPGYGPSDPFDDSIMPDDGPQESVRGQAKIVRTAYGYRFLAASQNTHLRLSLANGRLRFRDTRVPSWKSLPGACTRQRVDPGIAATCRVPGDTSADDPTLLEVRPRLGNDYVDGRGLPATFEMAVLADAGRDTLFGGRGNDYLGGATDNDRAHGGPGKDWIRGGSGRDRLLGGANGDWINGLSGRDVIRGGSGRDRTFQ